MKKKQLMWIVGENGAVDDDNDDDDHNDIKKLRR